MVFQTPRGEADSQEPLAVGATAKPQQNALILAGGLHTCWKFAVTVGLLLDRAGFGVANRDFFIAAEKRSFKKFIDCKRNPKALHQVCGQVQK